MLVCDTSGLVAFFDASDVHCDQVTAVISSERGPFIVSPYVIAELDGLIATRRGVRAELRALNELAGGAWELATLDARDIKEASRIIDRYADQSIGLTDASLVVLANRYHTDRLLTLDRRHFQVVQTFGGKRFTLLPEQI